MNINRNQIMANKIVEKDIIQIETDLKHNSFYNESDKRAIRTYIGAMDSREIGEFDISIQVHADVTQVVKLVVAAE